MFISHRYENYVVIETVDGKSFEIVLPKELPLDKNAVEQLISYASIVTPSGRSIKSMCATPDFHKGSNIPVGTMLAFDSDIVVPSAIGTDINCGMRLHQFDIGVDTFLSQRKQLISLLRGDILEGTRNMPSNGAQMAALAVDGLFGWLSALQKNPSNMWRNMDFKTQFEDLDYCFDYGWMQGDSTYLPEPLKRSDTFRDSGFATVGSGNHFLEFGVVEEIYDTKTAYAWNIKKHKLTVMVHSGSRDVGHAIGRQWMDIAKQSYPIGRIHPNNKIYTLEGEFAKKYLKAMAVAVNYGYANRVSIVELVRQRLLQVFGDYAFNMISDIPHNIITQEGDLNVHRKGSTPAYEGSRLLIPGSMGASSYILRGCGNSRFQSTVSHGAGRAIKRQRMYRRDIDASIDCVTLKEERRIEEDPSAYKPIEPIINSQESLGMLTKVARIKPLITFKA